MDIIDIADSCDPRLERFRDLRDSGPRHRGDVIVDSARVAVRALASGIEVTGILAVPEFFDDYAEQIAACSSATLYRAPRKILEGVVGFRLHQGVVVLAARPTDAALSGLGPVVVALNGVAEADNLGAIIRNCRAFAATGLLVDGTSCSPWLRRAVRVSMGTVFGMAVRHSPDFLAELGQLSASGSKIVAIENSADAEPIGKAALEDPCVLIFGSEGAGIAEGVLRAADQVVSVPMTGGIDSLNVACTSAIILWYRFSRGRGEGKG